jgi:hypothetical protein
MAASAQVKSRMQLNLLVFGWFVVGCVDDWLEHSMVIGLRLKHSMAVKEWTFNGWIGASSDCNGRIRRIQTSNHHQ